MKIYIEEHSQIFLKIEFETWRLALFTFSKSRVLSIPTSTFEVRDEMYDHLLKRSQPQDDWRQETTHGSFKLLRILWTSKRHLLPNAELSTSHLNLTTCSRTHWIVHASHFRALLPEFQRSLL